MSEMMQPVDVVIAWVDGNDPKLKQKRMQYQGKTQASDAVSDTRFASNHEIYYNVASILKYVPFCRHIYIVTDGQQPQWIDDFVQDGICETGKIRIVDHREIFMGYEQYLPTFNTRSIETMLWNIQGLSDYFFYLNDDFFFNAPAQLEDILIDQKMVIYGHWQSSFVLKAKLWYRQVLNQYFNKPIQPKHMIAQMLGADMLGFKKFFEIHHYPHAVDRKILQDYLLAYPKFLEKQIQYKFRSVEQINPISLMNHLKIQKDEALLKPDLEIAYLKNESSLSSFLQSLGNEQIKYGCMQSLDQLSDAAAAEIYAALNQKLVGYIPKVLLAETAKG
ncbi:stealth family protein [Acinetobacter sp. NIPH 1869]|uniref:Stealth CR1 domain-containing protein n=1 Tax=Acinetobacter higginsii TaxID=70347 RepID=UPI001F4BA0C7|nr:Stealth CR1 domain-containing protein [Acinetobacter higginsii]MCH7303493.1 stealth family protein [Acinetobacter higginsii]